MSYFQKHMKYATNQNQTSLNNKSNNCPITNCSNVRKFQKNVPNKPRATEGLPVEAGRRSQLKDRKSQVNLSHVETNRIKAVAKIDKPLPTRKPIIKDDEVSMSSNFQALMAETDNSMQEMLNSSINQFWKYLEGEGDSIHEQSQLITQNRQLRASLGQLRTILKQRLQQALKKQKDELSSLMQEYVCLIQKLLADKDELSANLLQTEQKLKQVQAKSQQIAKQKQNHITKTKLQIDDFLQIIDQYEQEAELQNQDNHQMKIKIQELQAQLKQNRTDETLIHKLNAQTAKINTLLELLEQAQQENKHLRQILQTTRKQQGGNDDLDRRMTELQRQHEQQFIQYERAVKETINKKDECIERLTTIIQSYRQRDKTHKQLSFSTTADIHSDHFI